MATKQSMVSEAATSEARLLELFKENDVTEKGYLSAQEVKSLCKGLHLGPLNDRFVHMFLERHNDKMVDNPGTAGASTSDIVNFLDDEFQPLLRKNQHKIFNFQQIYLKDLKHHFLKLLKEWDTQQISIKDCKELDKSPKAEPKLVFASKKYGRRSLPFNSEKSLIPLPKSMTSQGLKAVDVKDSSLPRMKSESKQAKGKHGTGKHGTGKHVAREHDTTRSAVAGVEITYEDNEGLPGEDERREHSMKHLRYVCQQLGVGGSGSLSQSEFKSVCAYIGMDNIGEKELAELFIKLDTDQDGQVTLADLVNGLPHKATLHAPVVSRFRSSTHAHVKTPRPRSHPRSQADKLTSSTDNFLYSGDKNGIFSSLEHTLDGYADGENVVDFWYGLGITNGLEVLSALGFDPNGKVKLSDITTALNNEMNNPQASEIIQHVTMETYQQEVFHLKSIVEQSKAEIKKLKLDLAESNARNSLLAGEGDERFSQMDKSWATKLVTVEQKYQEQNKFLQSELNQERKSGATKVGKLREEVEEMLEKLNHTEERLAEQTAQHEKELTRLMRDLDESSKQIKYLKNQNENLKSDLQYRIGTLANNSPAVDELKRTLAEQQNLLARRHDEIKSLKDSNDELMVQLEVAKQELHLAQRQKDPLVRAKDEYVQQESNQITESKMSVSVLTETGDEDAFTPIRPVKSRKRPKLQTQSSPNDDEPFSLNKELLKHEIEEREREKENIEQSYKMELASLHEKYKLEQKNLLASFENEKEQLIQDQAIQQERAVSEKVNELRAAFATETQDLKEQFVLERESSNQRHKQELMALSERLTALEYLDRGNEKLDQVVKKLETQLAQCHHEVCDLETQKYDLNSLLRQQEASLRKEFEGDRRNLLIEFTQKLEQSHSNYRQQLGQIFARGFDGLSGKLKEEFILMVKKATDREVAHSQAAILNQLQKDRSVIAKALEKERYLMYEEGEAVKLALMEKYESQIAALTTELNFMRLQFEAQKQNLANTSDKECNISQDALQKANNETEEDLVSELAEMKQRFESQRKDLEKQKAHIEEQKLNVLRDENQKKASEIDSLKAHVDKLKMEKNYLKKEIEAMKNLLESYQKKELEAAVYKLQLNNVKLEEQNQGKEEVKVAFSDGYTKGAKDEFERGYEEGKKDGAKEKLENGKAEGQMLGFDDGKKESEILGYSDGKAYGNLGGYIEGNKGFKENFEDGDAKGKGYIDGKNDGEREGFEYGKKEGKDEGSIEGKKVGREEGYSEGKAEGFIDGKKEGFNEGYEKGKLDGTEEGISEGGKKGYNKGKKEGFDEGYETGKKDGKEEGYDVGFENGKLEGYNEGKIDGYNEGKDEGYEEGYNCGKSDGIYEGCIQGEKNGQEKGYIQGKSDGFDTGKKLGLEEGYSEKKKIYHEEGLSEGKRIGHDEGKKIGHEEGLSEGKRVGHEEGLSEGKRIGHDEGKKIGHEEGYDEGLSEGKKIGHEEGLSEGKRMGHLEGYEEGHSEGKKIGHEEGHSEGKKIGHEEGYEKGHSEGKKIGHEEGHSEGKKIGHEEGLSEGKRMGHEEGYEEGHSEGKKIGHEEGHSEGKKIGHEEGYEKGHSEGKKIGHEEGHSEGKKIGHEKGHSEGKKIGHEKGYSEGKKIGHEEGYEEGHEEGKKIGHEEGYSEGKKIGHEEGHSEGKKIGHEEGYSEGKKIGHEEGYAKGKIDGFNEGNKIGFLEGYQEGEKNGLANGYAQGKNEGQERGFKEGKNKGHEEGYVKGLKEGKEEGYKQGKSDGFNEGCTQGEKDGYEMGYTQGKNDGMTEGHHKGKSEGLQEGFINGKAEGFTEGHAQGKRDEHDEAYKNGKKDGLEEGYKQGQKEGTDEGYKEGFRKGKQDVELQREAEGVSYKEQIQQMLGPLIQEKSVLEGRLRQEKEKFKRLSQEITDKDQLQHALEIKNQKAHEALLQEHTAEKAALLEKIQQLETQQKNVQSDKKAIEDHIEAVQQELEQAQKEINEELFQSVSVSKPESGIGSTEDHGNLVDQITTLHKQLKEAKKDQLALGLLQDEYNLLLKDKADLEDTIKKIKFKSAQDEKKKITSNVAEIKQLKEEKLKMQNLLDQASDQLMKASSSMALAQVKFAKELEELKENSKSMVELENYTQIQINLIEQQRQVLTLQDAIKEREAVMEQLIKEADKEKQKVIHEMENKIKDMQEKLDFSQDLLLKQRDKFKDMCAINRSRNLTLKELYEENAELMKKLAESDEKRRYFERMERKLKEKCETYKKTMESLHLKLAR